jgi:glutaredoxin
VDVMVYTRPGCSTCGQLKDYLRQHGVRFHERDVTTDLSARQQLESMHVHGVPVTVIDGLAVIGFDKDRLDDELKAHGVPIPGAP